YNAFSYFGSSVQNSSPKVFYSAEFPKDKYYVSFSNSDSIGSYYYYVLNPNIPASVSIPTSTITGNYNSSLNKYENISTIGTVDQIGAYWQYTSSDNKLGINWLVYKTGTAKEIIRPTLPQEILTQIPELNLSLLQPSSLGLYDYDTASSMEEIINMFFKTASPYYSKYNSYYSYTRLIKN
ncbi:MAG: hypothetical protein Q8S01_11920, partial [Ignavibacteria bacterium]|nr:hypothetical protein [Ignavibacteria bacterium]